MSKKFLNTQTLNYLQRIHIKSDSASDKYIKSMETLLKRQSLNYISINTSGYSDIIKMVKSLNNALQTTISKKSMKIRIISTDKSVTFNDINSEILKLVKILKRNTNDFMIIGSIDIKSDNKINSYS